MVDFPAVFSVHCRRDFTVCGFRDDNGLRTLDNIIRHNHIPSYREAVHEVGIIGDGHLTVAYGPITVCTQNLSVVVACISWPSSGIYKSAPSKAFI